MTAPVSNEENLAVTVIEIGVRLRPVVPAGIASIRASIRELGVLKDPIHVRALRGGRFRLIAGAHRLEAVREEGWDTVPARIWSGTGVTDDWARLMEIDDNLAGAEMDALDTAVFLAERRRVYLKMHPERAVHVAGGFKRWNAGDIESPASFAAVTAAKFGISERHVMRLAAAGDAVRGEAGARLRQSGCTVRLNDLLALAKADPDSRAEAIERFAAGEVTRLSRALRAPVVKDPSDPVEEAFRALRAQWERAPEAARRRFVAEHHAALSTRVREETERRIIASKLGVAPDDERVDRVKANFGPRAGRAAS